MKRFAAVLAVASLLAGCTGDVCSRMDSIAESLNKKSAACNETYTNGLSKSECQAKVSSCSSEDQAKVHKWLDCIEGLPNCEAGKSDEFEHKFLSCATTQLKGVSQACIAGMTGGGE